jgi:hypothetical protein
MTRALAWLLRGDISRSFGYHPLALPAAIGTIGAVLWYAGRRWRGWDAPPTRLTNSVLISFGVLLVVVWVVRLASGTLPPV